MKNIFIREAGRLIWDIMEIYHQENLEDLLVTMDIEKAFDSLTMHLLYCLGFIAWMKLLLSNQELCVINKKIQPQLIFLCLEVLFLDIKNVTKIKGIKVSNYCYLYNGNADDTNFFLKINLFFSCRSI